jgi:hypothetical protein
VCLVSRSAPRWTMEPPPQHRVPYWTTLCPDGLQLTPRELSESGVPVKRRTIKRHRDGTVETYEDDGTLRTEYLDGTVTTLHPCGRVETALHESTVDGDEPRRDGNAAMKFRRIAPSDQEKRRRIIRGRRAGPSLPSNAARKRAEARRDEDDEDDDRPDVLMYGGHDVLPSMQKELSGMARRCEINMRPGCDSLLHDERGLEAPAYLKHFAGTSLATDWVAPELDVEEEERGWRNEYYKEQSNPDRLSDRDNLLQEFKFRKRSKRTEVEDEVWRSEKSRRDDAYSARLEQLKADLAEEKARATKRDAKVKAREERLAREQQEAKEALRKLEEEDLENRVYPDAIPAYLMDRPQYFFHPSKLPGNKREVLAEAQQPVVVVAPLRPAQTVAKCGGQVGPESEDEEVAVVEGPPDDVGVNF